MIFSPWPIFSKTTIRCLPPLELDKLLGRARDLTKQYLEGGAASFAAFRELIQFLLDQTVMAENGAVRAEFGPRKKRDRAVISGRLADGVVPLLDGRYLKIVIEVYLDPKDGDRLKVAKSLLRGIRLSCGPGSLTPVG